MKSIHTLSDLKKKKKQLRLEMKVAKRAFIHGFGTTRTQAKEMLFKKVVAPVGIASLLSYGAHQWISANKSNESNKGYNYEEQAEVYSDSSFSVSSVVKKILPQLIPVVLAYIQQNFQTTDPEMS